MKISVIGAGVMGARVTEVLIKGGHDVVMIDTNRDHATGSLNRIVADLAIGVEKGKLTKEESDAALARITISNMCSDAAGAALVLECINEHLDDKVTLLKQLDTVLDEDCIIGTNTSALPISEIARAVPHRADHILGVHFFNPAPVMKLVEERQAARKARDFARADAIRDELAALGYAVEDTPEGPKVKPI